MVRDGEDRAGLQLARADGPGSSSDSRQAFRDRLRLDHGTWARGRGWALWKALITLANDGAGAAAERFGWRIGARQVIDEVLADHG